MKKILLSFLFFVFVSTTHAFIPSHINDFTIWRINQIEQNNDWIKLNFDNFIYYKISDKIRIFKERNTFINKMTAIKEVPNDLSLKVWDIVAIDSYWSWESSGILKIACENDIMKIEWTKNKYFWTSPSTSNIEAIDNFKWNDYKLLEKMNEVVWCDNLDSLFDKDRRFEDLDWNNLNIYTYGILWFFIFILWIIAFFIFRKK